MSDKLLINIVKGFTGLILLLFLLFAFVINPGVNNDNFSNETLWEAVHPFHWLFDTIGMIGFTAVALYVGGFLGKVVYAFTEPRPNSSGFVHVIAGAGILCVLLIFV